MDFCMIAFASTHAAISAQALLKGICPTETMPVLRAVSTGCGIALRLRPEDCPFARNALSAAPLPRSDYSFWAVTGVGSALTAKLIEREPPDSL